jgi:mitogen-activated protein kinase kinase kinase
MGGVCMKHPDVIENNTLNKKSPENPNKDNLKANLLREEEDASRVKYKKDQIDSYDKNSPDGQRSPMKNNKKKNLEFIKGELIGSGQFSSLYSGLSINTGEIVAIKVVKLNKKTNLIKQISDVNKAVGKLGELNHKNIIKYICIQPTENTDEIEIIFEYCNGGSIKQLLDKFDSFDEKLIKLYTRQILEGLVCLHDQNIIHRSIKSCNILVDGNGMVKLSDFVVSNILIGDDPESILYFNTNNPKGKFFK